MSRQPWYQWMVLALMTAVTAITVTASALDALSGVRNYITPEITRLGSIGLFAVAMIVHILLRLFPIKWKYNTESILVTGLGLCGVAVIAGLIILLWFPRLLLLLPSRKPKTPPVVQVSALPLRKPAPVATLLLVDVSRSMEGTPCKRIVSEQIRRERPDANIGLAIFSDRAKVRLEPARYPLAEYMRQLSHVDRTQPPCTNLLQSIADAGKFLTDRYRAERTKLVVLSDGMDQPCLQSQAPGYAFERLFPQIELHFILLGRGDRTEIERLFPSAKLNVEYHGIGGRYLMKPDELP